MVKKENQFNWFWTGLAVFLLFVGFFYRAEVFFAPVRLSDCPKEPKNFSPQILVVPAFNDWIPPLVPVMRLGKADRGISLTSCKNGGDQLIELADGRVYRLVGQEKPSFNLRTDSSYFFFLAAFFFVVYWLARLMEILLNRRLNLLRKMFSLLALLFVLVPVVVFRPDQNPQEQAQIWLILWSFFVVLTQGSLIGALAFAVWAIVWNLGSGAETGKNKKDRGDFFWFSLATFTKFSFGGIGLNLVFYFLSL